MYQNFYINKQSGTYAEALEAFGVAKLLDEILQRKAARGKKIIIEDKHLHYVVTTNIPITDEMLSEINYFQIIKFIIKEKDTPIPDGISKSDCFNYPIQKAIVDEYKDVRKKISEDKTLKAEEKKFQIKELNERQHSEFGSKIDPEFDVYREIKGNPYASFCNLYNNFHNNQDNFSTLVKQILHYYALGETTKVDFKLTDEKPTSLQLYNPHQGKGLNKNKANNASMGPQKSIWISETMKIAGALEIMSCQYVKVGSGYDLKIFVPEFNDIQLDKVRSVLFDFKKYLKSSSPIKLDILNLLNLLIHFIKNDETYRGKIKNTLRGFHTVYQKDLGQNKAVANIAFFNTPEFLAYENKMEGVEWIKALEEQIKIISAIEELGDAVQGLLAFREFLGNSNFQSLSKFLFWYANHLMQALTQKKYTIPFQVKTLTKIFNSMDTNLKEIIQNKGFLKVATAIRQSTVYPQIAKGKGEKPLYDIRYGLAQKIKNKANSESELITFLSEFLGNYESENSMAKEKLLGKARLRNDITKEELDEFYSLFDGSDKKAKKIAALLVAYGFAIDKKITTEEDTVNSTSENNSEDFTTDND